MHGLCYFLGRNVPNVTPPLLWQYTKRWGNCFTGDLNGWQEGNGIDATRGAWEEKTDKSLDIDAKSVYH